MEEKLKELEAKVKIAIAAAKTLSELQEVHNLYFSRKGELAGLMNELAKLSSAERPKMGQAINSAKVALLTEFEQKQSELKRAEMESQLEEEWVDITAPGVDGHRGHIHPLSQVQQEVEEIFSSMGFEIKDGPEVESEYFNFEGLNIPASHPARDMQDTFFVDENPDKDFGRLVLRTHTSPVQVRTMQAEGAPLRIIVPGRVFRYEATDASHDSTFYQVEGLLVDEDISLAHLKGVMEEFLTRLFQKEVHVRFRPGYFPFVEPGLELDFGCLLCEQKGCKTCKFTGWIEFMGAGMVHPFVLKAGGINPEKYQGWAFGFGLTRLVMMRHRIPDIRLNFGGDVRFLNQF
ncbi:phenylalanine--tRNA ligase subunit alpha [Patescibacteria group bacterium]|nr:phenylalanine--tRNA ligase subunit alpha [Patescibacteria group bacterium]